MLCVCLLTAGLTLAAYTVTGAPLFRQNIADEMLPRASGIARLAERYQTGQMSFDTFIDLSLREQRGSRVYIYDGECNLIAYTDDTPAGQKQGYGNGNGRGTGNGTSEGGDMLPEMKKIAESVIETGESVTKSNPRARIGIVVAVPIEDNVGRVTGVILMNRPTAQVNVTLNQVLRALAIGCAAVSLLLIVPVYLLSKRISLPIRRMTEISNLMAGGNFSVRADERGRGEIAQLGKALNFLSAKLNENIQDLLLAKNRLHTILTGLTEGVAAFGSENDLLYCNPSALSLLDCGEGAALSAKLAPVFDLFETAKDTGETQSRQLHDGERTLLLSAARSQDSMDTGTGVILVISDVTAAERLEQTRRDYVANVSHELRTPIASIRSLAETLNDGLCKSEEDRARYYGYILRESMRLSRLINDLLELSRLQSGSVALEKRAFPLNELVNEVVERKRIDADYSGLSIRVKPGVDDGLCVCSNRDRIEQVLVALIDNAIKFSSDDGMITVETLPEGDHAVVTVQNTGRIPDASLPHLFERFYKADTAHSDTGTGLGLAITQEILTLLGEEIHAENADGAAVFRFTVHCA